MVFRAHFAKIYTIVQNILIKSIFYLFFTIDYDRITL